MRAHLLVTPPPDPSKEGDAASTAASTAATAATSTTATTTTPLLRPAVVVFPGGGYGLLSKKEAERAVKFLTERAGVHAVVVSYRVQRRHPAPLLDARRGSRALAEVRERVGRGPVAVGVLGFSAGGHLLAT